MVLKLTFQQFHVFLKAMAWLLVLMPTALLPAQTDQPSNSLAIEDGPIQEVASVLQKALRLKTPNGSNLELDKSKWSAPKKDLEKLIAMKAQLYMKRGVDKATARRLAENIGKAQAPSPLADVFAQLRLHGMTSVGHSRSGNVSTTRCGGALMNCTATFADSGYEFTVRETIGRQLTFFAAGDRIRMTYIDDDRIAILNQSKMGITGVLTGETVLSGSSRDFRQFGIEHPDLDQKLKKIFRHVGVDFLPNPRDAEVKQKVISRVLAIYSDSSAELDELIQQLDASDFETREKATKQIINGFDRFKNWIANRLDDDSLPIEAKKRLDKIVKDAQNNQQEDARVDQCIDTNELLRSPQYLVGLLETLSDDNQVLFMKLLGDLTQEQFGQDVIAWQDWAKSQKSKEN